MTEVNFGADLKAAEKEFNIGVGSDKFKEGENGVQSPYPLSRRRHPKHFHKSGEASTNVEFGTQIWDVASKALNMARKYGYENGMRLAERWLIMQKLNDQML